MENIDTKHDRAEEMGKREGEREEYELCDSRAVATETTKTDSLALNTRNIIQMLTSKHVSVNCS